MLFNASRGVKDRNVFIECAPTKYYTNFPSSDSTNMSSVWILSGIVRFDYYKDNL
jgi:hypothetical protein